VITRPAHAVEPAVVVDGRQLHPSTAAMEALLDARELLPGLLHVAECGDDAAHATLVGAAGQDQETW
jgi:hypothetical protein